jgi:parallel beta-helix repeat protein
MYTTTGSTQSNGTQSKRYIEVAGTVILALCGLLTLLMFLRRPVVAEIGQTVGYVDGEQGVDEPGCGAFIGTQACKTIQYAIDEPMQYHIIKVTAGVYTERIRIDRDAQLQGGWNVSFTLHNPISYSTTIVGESGTGAHAVTIANSTKVVLDSLTVFQGDDGVHLQAGAGARLVNLVVHGTDDEGIESDGVWLIVSNTQIFDTGDNGLLAAAGRAEVFDSTVHDTGDRGIYLRGDGPDTISQTLVYRTRNDGIRMRDAGSGLLTSNWVHSVVRDGIQIDDVVRVEVTGNTVHDAGGDGLKLDGANSATIHENTIHDVGGQGLQLQRGDLVRVEANNVFRTESAGILAENAGATAIIQGNTVYSTTGTAADGIHVSPGVVATVKQNIVRSVTDDAVDFKGVSGTIEENVVSFSDDVGIWVSGTASISVIHNQISKTVDTGIQVENSGTVLIAHNRISHTISDTADAIYVGLGVDATIDYNTVYSAASDGIDFRGATGWIRFNEVHRVGDQGINVNADDTAVLSNVVFDTQSEGLRVQSGSTVVIRGNTIHDALGEQMDGIHVEPNVIAVIAANSIYRAADDGITFNGARGTIEENDIHDNGASGLDVNAEEVTISANRVFSNGWSGIELEEVVSFTLSNNLVGENRVGGMQIGGNSMGLVVNNTLVGHPWNPRGVGVHVLSPGAIVTSVNNIVISHATGIAVIAGARVTTTYDDVWSNSVDYQGIMSGAGSIAQDPLLADIGARDYHVLQGSPCLDAGWSALSPFYDFEGDPRVGQVDIGADELVKHHYLPTVLKDRG